MVQNKECSFGFGVRQRTNQSGAAVLPKKDMVRLRLRSSEATQRPVSHLLGHKVYRLDHREGICHRIIWVVFIPQPGWFAGYANPHSADKQGKSRKGCFLPQQVNHTFHSALQLCCLKPSFCWVMKPKGLLHSPVMLKRWDPFSKKIVLHGDIRMPFPEEFYKTSRLEFEGYSLFNA